MLKSEFVCKYFLRKLRSVEENFIASLLIHTKFYIVYPGGDIISVK